MFRFYRETFGHRWKDQSKTDMLISLPHTTPVPLAQPWSLRRGVCLRALWPGQSTKKKTACYLQCSRILKAQSTSHPPEDHSPSSDNPSRAITPADAVSPLRAITPGRRRPPQQRRLPGDLQTIGVDWGTTSFIQSHPGVRHVSRTKNAHSAFWQVMAATGLHQQMPISLDKRGSSHIHPLAGHLLQVSIHPFNSGTLNKSLSWFHSSSSET